MKAEDSSSVTSAAPPPPPPPPPPQSPHWHRVAGNVRGQVALAAKVAVTLGHGKGRRRRRQPWSLSHGRLHEPRRGIHITSWFLHRRRRRLATFSVFCLLLFGSSVLTDVPCAGSERSLLKVHLTLSSGCLRRDRASDCTQEGLVMEGKHSVCFNTDPPVHSLDTPCPFTTFYTVHTYRWCEIYVKQDICVIT